MAHYSLPIGTTCERYGCTLTLTEEGWRAEVKHNMHRRCRDWDYCKPWIYLITLNTQHHDEPPYPIDQDGHPLSFVPPSVVDASSTPDLSSSLPDLSTLYAKPGHPHLFGELAPDLDADGHPYIQLNAFGRAIEQSIDEIPQHYPEVAILSRVVMPNHLHIILRILTPLPSRKPLGYLINHWKSSVNRLYKELVLGVPKETWMHVSSNRPQAESTRLQATRRKSGGHGSKDPNTGLVLEPNFHDRILFRSGQLARMFDYVRDNPRRLWEVVHNRLYFEKVADWRITMPLLPQGGTQGTGRWWQYYPGGTQALEAEDGAHGLLAPLEINGSSMTADDVQMTLTFNAIGNRSLLQVPERMQIQCSRSMSADAIQQLIDEVLEACHHGVVIVSPCISEGEKQVARAVMSAGHQLIVIFPRGIPANIAEYKPYGEFFDACARGQLLILSPWAYVPGVTHLARWQCLMLNDIAAQLSL